MPFSLKPLRIPGLVVLVPGIFGDARGYFLESWNERDFAGLGIGLRFVQDNLSGSHRGVLRGLHFQKEHPQGKLLQVLSGEVFDVALDLRQGSASFGEWEGTMLSAKDRKLLYIPPGFAHGYLVLSEEAVFAYKCTDYYYSGDEDGIRWDDPALGIEWPDLGTPPELSEKDSKLPPFDRGREYFAADGNPVGAPGAGS
jgi:dTDP-4-dehydrorhamnose 3,5-epimerase